MQAALDDSQSAFLVALNNVLEARNVAEVARTSKLNRVHIYRMLGGQGNPTMKSLDKILHAVGLGLSVTLQNKPAPLDKSSPQNTAQTSPTSWTPHARSRLKSLSIETLDT